MPSPVSVLALLGLFVVLALLLVVFFVLPASTRQHAINTTGPVGGTGPTGPEGIQGSGGPRGPLGPQGDPGPPGTAANTGAAGPPGATGPAGAATNTGAAGPTGPEGVTGPAGTATNTGPTGPQGTMPPPSYIEYGSSTATQTISAGVDTLVTNYDTVIVGSNNASSLGFLSGIWTPTVAGTYTVAYTVGSTTAISGLFFTFWEKNGSARYGGISQYLSSETPTQSTSFPIICNGSTDNFRMICHQTNSGGSITIGDAGGITQTRVTVTYDHP